MYIHESKNEIDALGQQLAHQMYGHNYAPSVGVLKITNAQSLADIQKDIKTQYENTEPSAASYIIVEKDVMLNQIQECFDYRGDAASGLELTSEQEVSLKESQQQFINSILSFIENDTVIFSTDLENGLPVYYTFWHFAFVVLNPKGESLFLFGAASD